jgi:hypothetical protein
MTKEYLNKRITLFQLVNGIEMIANSMFDSSDTEEFYTFLINFIGDLECEYFMKADEVTNKDEFNYRRELIDLVKDFKIGLEKYKQNFI